MNLLSHSQAQNFHNYNNNLYYPNFANLNNGNVVSSNYLGNIHNIALNSLPTVNINYYNQNNSTNNINHNNPTFNDTYFANKNERNTYDNSFPNIDKQIKKSTYVRKLDFDNTKYEKNDKDKINI